MQKKLLAGLKRQRGICDPFLIVMVAACLVVGGLYAIYSKKIDAPVEQAAEAVLKSKGIDIDFSAGKKSDDE